MQEDNDNDNDNDNENNNYEDVNMLIPIKKIQKYKHLFGVTLDESSPYLHLYQINTNNKQKNAYASYSAESLIKLMRVVNQNTDYFLRFYAFNTTLSKNNKKQFIVNRILRESGSISFYQLCEQLKHIRKQIKNKQLFQQHLKFIVLFLKKMKHVLYKFCDPLVMVISDCVNFYLKKTQKSKTQEKLQKIGTPKLESQQVNQQTFTDYQVVIGFNKLNISFNSSTQYIENVMKQHINYLRQVCAMCDYDWNSKINFNGLKTQPNNMISSRQMPKQLQKKIKQQKFVNSKQKQSLPESFYSNLVLQTFVKYTEDIFFLIQASIVFLTNLVLEKKQLKNINYNQQFIDMHEFRQKQTNQTFMNLYCQHFQGITAQNYKNDQSCPLCDVQILVDQLKSFQRNKNVFQILLGKNYLNQNTDNIVYYFKNKIFCLATKQKFSNYAHFCQFIKTENYIRDRPQVSLLMEFQRISLYDKLWGKKKLFFKEELVSTPVRGKYCRHIEFFQLVRVYELYLKRQEGQTEFQCFLCMQPIQYADVMYLHEMKLLIDIIKLNFYEGINITINSWVEIDHRLETVVIGSQLDKGYLKKTFGLCIYNTIIDPLTKSQKQITKGPLQNKQEGQDQQKNMCVFNSEFQSFFFGY